MDVLGDWENLLIKTGTLYGVLSNKFTVNVGEGESIVIPGFSLHTGSLHQRSTTVIADQNHSRDSVQQHLSEWLTRLAVRIIGEKHKQCLQL